jgi:hypothetical protein
MRPDRPRDLARRIAFVMLDGADDEASLRERMMRSFRPLTPWLVEMAVELLRFAPAPRSPDALVERILAQAQFRQAAGARVVPRWVRMSPVALPPPLPRLPVVGLPVMESPQALADWLGIEPGQLAWLADPWSQEALRSEGPLRHYRYRWRPREYGPDRLIEMPKRQLRTIQRRLYAEVLAHVPLHAAAHGFVRARSPLTHARLHAGRDWVLRMDLAQFFVNIGAARVRGVFRLLGYPKSVAVLLAGLCTNSVPAGVCAMAPHGPLGWEDRARLRLAHLPQGAPSSPALANILAWRLDTRLAAWAAARGLTYSRYADDLTFSADGVTHAQMLRHEQRIAVIVADCGFCVNSRKTCCFGQHQAQRVTGLVVNRHPNVARAEFDRLKAILTRCARLGPQDENREHRTDFRAWLRGRVAWCAGVNPVRAAKLERLYAQIAWE